MRTLYTAFIHVYSVLITIAAVFNGKAKLWVNGRKNIFDEIALQLKNNNKQVVWIHCASLGEFEQGRPLIEKIKEKEPSLIIVLTFFSPSGYEIRKKYTGADFVFYLPIDTISNAKKFIAIVKPNVTFFVKYEFWFNYLNELKKQHTPTYLISGIFRDSHYFFKWYGKWFRKQLHCFTHFYLQNTSSQKLLHSIGYKNTSVAGDTRFDRVFEISKNVKAISFIEEFKQDKKILIAGSTWNEDENILSTLNFKTSNFKLIIAPHEINEEHLKKIETIFSKHLCLRYSNATEKNIKLAHILIIDNVGMLSSLYQYGTIAFIGGGFGKGIHNILEAATFGLPVMFGPNYHKFKEAEALLNLGGAFAITNADEFKNRFEFICQPENLKSAAEISKHFILSNIGATNTILNSYSLKKNRL